MTVKEPRKAYEPLREILNGKSPNTTRVKVLITPKEMADFYGQIFKMNEIDRSQRNLEFKDEKFME